MLTTREIIIGYSYSQRGNTVIHNYGAGFLDSLRTPVRALPADSMPYRSFSQRSSGSHPVETQGNHEKSAVGSNTLSVGHIAPQNSPPSRPQSRVGVDQHESDNGLNSIADDKVSLTSFFVLISQSRRCRYIGTKRSKASFPSSPL